MIPATPLDAQTAGWQRELADAITSPRELLERLDLAERALRIAPRAAGFPLRVPRAFLARMRRGDPDDPLLRQVLPLDEELRPVPGFVADPLDEAAAIRVPGLMQKYRGRALLVTTGACAVHCRYCFRREFPYAEQLAAGTRLEAAIEEIARDPTIEEVILSGGDPLSLSDARLRQLSDALARIAHLRRLRIHTRMPVVLPSRVDRAFLDWLSGIPWPSVVVLHANHAREIDADVARACEAMRAAGAQLLNQSVLLAGVNDSLESLETLSVRLFEAGVLPYYLHLLDPVRGAAHFAVSESAARALWAALAARLPGYLVPRLVREEPGAVAKSPISVELSAPVAGM